MPSTATKQSHAAVRDKYKVMLLATQYGMSSETLASTPRHLDVRSTRDAHPASRAIRAVLEMVRRLGAARLADRHDAHGLWLDLRTGITEFNERSIRNWPIQATGADILRIACILAARHGIRLLAPVHDAVLIEAPIERIEADVALMQEIMRRASRIVLNAEPTARTNCVPTNIVRYPDRYSDQRGEAIWECVMRLLADQQRKVA